MSEFRKLVENFLEQNNNLEEGKFSKFLGTMATAAAIGLGGLHANPASAASYQPDHQEQVLRTKLNTNVPNWVENAGKISTDNGKMYFTSEIVRGPESNNTAQLERAASLQAGSQLFQALSGAVNAKLDSNMNKIGDKLAISTMIPKKSYWVLLNGDDGKEYHAYSQIQIDKNQITKALTSALQKANPNTNNAKIKQIVQNAIQSIASI